MSILGYQTGLSQPQNEVASSVIPDRNMALRLFFMLEGRGCSPYMVEHEDGGYQVFHRPILSPPSVA